MHGSVPREALSITNCDREPIHIPGSIQPFGALVAAPLDLDRIDYASDNLESVMGTSTGEALGRSVSDLLGKEATHDIRNLIGLPSAKSQRERAGVYTLGGARFEVYAHRNVQDRAVIEVEPLEDAGPAEGRPPIDQIRIFLAQAAAEDSPEKVLKIAVHGLRVVTGYDRVKGYRFLPDGSGEVVAEARAGGVDSFLGLRYPAWDIPTQARALQIRNPLRLLSDVEQEPIGISAHDGDAAPLDLSLAHLRGISPIHVEYLKNMGVGGTLSLGIIIDGQLWGMFACHHMTKKVIGSDIRIAAELFAQMISLLIKEKTEAKAADARARAGKARMRILAETDAATDILNAFPSLAPILNEVIACDGIAVVREDKVLTDGSVPSMEAIRAISEHRPFDEDAILDTDSLAASGWCDGHPLTNSAGALLVRATAAYPLQLLFFRDEIGQNVRWAGKPEKDIEHGPMGPRITPRGSFEAYLEEQRDKSNPWNSHDLTAARELQISLTQITAKGERSQLLRHKDLISHQRQQDLMIAELNHRVKNILALIRSLSRQAKSSSASLESYARALEQRIAALAAAHDLAVSDHMKGVSLRSIISTEMQPYVDADSGQVILAGPLVGLRADVAPMVALVMHEVITNAAKYGSLSVREGIVQARWTKDEDGLHFTWRELGGPQVVTPSRHGFGRSLIERAIPYEFDGKVSLTYEPTGVEFTFDLPAQHLVDIEEETHKNVVGKIGEIKRVASGLSALLVEDNLVLAMDMVEAITRLGAERIETAATIDTALRQLDHDSFDFAVLDMNLRGTVAFDVALKLQELKTPFVFVTGYGSKIDVPAELRFVPILTKPVDDGSLSRTLGEVLARTRPTPS